MQGRSGGRGQCPYRPDIDGLRAFAVTLVIVFHLAPSFLPNGFIGVDIFFVISGYVVTSSVLGRAPESVLTGVLSFWKRRITRIYPALLVCILVTMIVILLLMPPFPLVIYRGTLRTGLAAVVGIGNLYLFRSQQNYFTADQSSNPFLHTWSLGIEEQFYVLFSLCFIATPLMVVASLGDRNDSKVKWIRILLIAILTLASAAILAGANSHGLGTYYLLQFRFWELGLGCLLAISSSIFDRPSGPFRVLYLARQFASMLALAVIGFVAMKPAIANPEPATALATLSCTVLIWLNSANNSSSNTLTAKALGSLPIRSVGLVSYSLYLWHWPLFVVFGLTVGLKSFGNVVLATGLVVILAVGSYFLIEKPFRRKQSSFWYRVVPTLGLTAAVIMGLSLGAELRPGFAFLGRSQAWTMDWLPDVVFSYAGFNKIRAISCDLGNGAAIPVDIPADCTAKIAQSSEAPPTVLSIGDSLAYADWGMLSYGFKQGTFQWSALSHDGCSINNNDDETSPSCQQYWTTMPERIRRSVGRDDYVFIAVVWTLDTGTNYERAFVKLKKILVAAETAGARVIIQAPLPQFGRDAFLCSTEWFRTNYEGCSIRRQDFDARRFVLMNAFGSLRGKYPDLLVWDPVDQLCDKDYCRQFAEGKPLFRNWDHLSYWGSLSLGPAFDHFLMDAEQGREKLRNGDISPFGNR